MPDYQSLYVHKFQYGEVSGEGGLHSFLTHDTETNVCLLNHSDIVTTISDARDDFFGGFLDVSGDDSFLRGTASTDAYCLRLESDTEEFLAERFISSNHTKSRTIDHQHMR